MSRYITILCLLAIFFTATDLFSQLTNGRSRYKRSAQVFDVKFGVALGFDRSWLKGDVYVIKPNTDGVGSETFTKFKGRYAYHGGFYVDFQVTENDYAQLDFKYVKKGWKQEGPFNFSPYSINLDSTTILNKVEVVYNITYIEIPMRYKRKLSDEWFVAAGPYFGFSLNESYKTTDNFGVALPETAVTSSNYLDINYGVTVGFIYQMENGLNFSAEYQHGLADINDYSGIREVPIPKNHLVTASMSIGYTLNYFGRLTNPRTRRKGLL